MTTIILGNSQYSRDDDTARSFFPNVFLKTVIGDQEPPRITKAKIQGNSMILTLNQLPIINGALKDASWFSFSYSGERNTQPTMKFNLSPENKYNFQFRDSQFHGKRGVIDNLFLNKDEPKDVQVSLSYKTPTAFWRGLPLPFLGSIKEFSFHGPSFGITWPLNGKLDKQDGRTSFPNQEELRISGNYTNSFDRKLEKTTLEPLKQRLIELDIQYQSKSIPKYPYEETSFLVKPERIDYQFMQDLEELTRQEFEGTKRDSLRNLEAEVIIEGTFNPEIFVDIPKIFDKYLQSHHYNSKVERENISVIVYDPIHFRTGENPLLIELKNSTLEDAEKLAGYLSGNFSSSSDPKQVEIVPYNKNKPREHLAGVKFSIRD